MLADLTVLDGDGKEVPVRDLWRDQPAVIVFIRHFG
jgi:hypothetical protein